MNIIEELKSEHEEIERELIELDEIVDARNEKINYPNLIHVFRKLKKFWDEHEEKEEKLFSILESENMKIPIEKLKFEHKLLRPHKERVKEAINSGSEAKMKKALEDNCTVIVKQLREHIDEEEDILFSLILSEIKLKDLIEMWEDANSSADFEKIGGRDESDTNV
ncbi:hemerythrin domain-containing protein [Candidatus Pacearchaeota archaeon]|nr:hemerythrin domain-containing protein [Candidatus Pacearchaeota archaeon]